MVPIAVQHNFKKLDSIDGRAKRPFLWLIIKIIALDTKLAYNDKECKTKNNSPKEFILNKKLFLTAITSFVISSSAFCPWRAVTI
jgi:hypothetical protein